MAFVGTHYHISCEFVAKHVMLHIVSSGTLHIKPKMGFISRIGTSANERTEKASNCNHECEPKVVKIGLIF